MWLLLCSSQEVFLAATSTIMIIAVIEWLNLLKYYDIKFIKNLLNNITYIAILFIICFFITKYYWLNPFFVKQIMLVATCFWFIVVGAVIVCSKFYQLILRSNSYFNIICSYLSCFFTLIPSWLAINYMQVYNKNLLLLCCLIIMAADIGAYVIGKLFGKHKLTKISPKKTWEGLLGGYVSSMLVVIVYIIFNRFCVKYNYHLIVISSVTFIFAVIGDLFESLLKRIVGVKDSGNILPGHGGILDRLDSFCAGAPIFLMGVLLYKL